MLKCQLWGTAVLPINGGFWRVAAERHFGDVRWHANRPLPYV